jgi:hypothetical protein
VIVRLYNLIFHKEAKGLQVACLTEELDDLI